MLRIGIPVLMLVLFGMIGGEAQERFVTTTDSVSLYVKVKGRGTPCLYIHGGPGSGSHWLEKFSGEMLEQHFQMVYLDQRGTARSSSPADSNYSMERMVKDFEEVRKALRIERWITMGHSFGGILQMGYVMRVPEACRGMIMINCTLDFNDTASTWIPKACEFLGITNTAPYMDRSKPIEERLPILMQKLKEKDLFWRMGYASKESENLMNATFADIPHWNHDLERMFARFPEYFQDYRTGAPAVKVPVLFFYGRTDWMVGPEHYKGVHFPHMLLWGSDVGHIPFIENKADLEKAIIEYITYDRQ